MKEGTACPSALHLLEAVAPLSVHEGVPYLYGRLGKGHKKAAVPEKEAVSRSEYMEVAANMGIFFGMASIWRDFFWMGLLFFALKEISHFMY